MREILFRGKRADNGEWVYGDFWHGNERKSLRDSIFVYDGETQSFNDFTIAPETLGQYTGLKDKNGTKIFEGDIVTYEDAEADYEGYHDNVFLNRGKVGVSAWDGIYFTNRQTVEMSDLYESETMIDCKVIGNLHDNPELLKGV